MRGRRRSQKCVRAGGKHNDLENVGFTRRHHTFFEMLGNFSFGDYFKKEAIAYAWELVTSPEWFGIPKDRLYVTIFKGENGVPRDEEAYELWLAQGVPAERIHEMWEEGQLLADGRTGPCGPCSEIFYDMGIEAAETPGVDKPFGEDEARYVEIWNLVFMQFDRDSAGRTASAAQAFDRYRDGSGPHCRSAAGKDFEFRNGFVRAADAEGERADVNRNIRTALAPTDASLRIIADHARAATFLISDGVNTRE